LLAKELIAQPQNWQLVLEVSPTALSVVAFSPDGNHALIHEEIAFDPAAATPLKALEDAVYNNSMLLLDFRKVTVIYATTTFLPMPVLLAPMAEKLLANAFAPENITGTQTLWCPLMPLKCAIAFAVPAAVLGFLQRTFHNATIVHPLVPQALWMSLRYPGGCRGKTLVNVRSNRLDLVILGEKAPLSINSYDITCATDALYYVLAARQAHGLTDTDEIFIAGERELRAQTSVLLRRYVRFVMPVILPAVMLRAGRAAFDAPFESILTSIVPLEHLIR